jgi:hypothetical protein
MKRLSTILHALAKDLLTPDQFRMLNAWRFTFPQDYAELVRFDLSLGGPALTRVSAKNLGRYNIADREVFRPYQYCEQYFVMVANGSGAEWLTRSIVHMSSVHLESLTKRIGHVPMLPLGTALREPSIQRAVHPQTILQLKAYAQVFNAAKHDVDHEMDTHLFSMDDAVLAYITSRVLGMKLYPLSSLKTHMDVFDQD